jgi:hypothetical protein
MKKLPLATALITNLIIGAPDVLASAIPVTIDNYNQAVAAKYMGNWDKFLYLRAIRRLLYE